LNTEQINAATMIAIVMGGTVSGSVLVTPLNANDIDIFISYSKFRLFMHTLNLDGTPYEFDYTYHGNKLKFTSHDWASSEEYQMNNRDDALVITYRSVPNGLVNIIVVNDEFVPAFKWSAKEMMNNPHLYTNREDRINLHHAWRNWIRDMEYSPGTPTTHPGIAQSFL